MPGPKMGPRPTDFDEPLVRQSPTYAKWMTLATGAKLRYACREFVKGHGDDEERLMRRIMIARRNNIRDHETLKQARRQSNSTSTSTSNSNNTTNTNVGRNTTSSTKSSGAVPVPDAAAEKSKSVAAAADAATNATDELSVDKTAASSETVGVPPTRDTAAAAAIGKDEPEAGGAIDMGNDDGANSKQARSLRRPPHLISDNQAEQEMDVSAVEKTRSYRSWMDLAHGKEFVYNQKYTKGKDGHDWLLRKNIWRRMRYRRENKEMVERMKTRPPLLRSALDANAAAANKEESSSQQQEDNVDLKPILPSDSKGLANESKKQGATIAASTTIPVMDDCAATHAAAAAASDLTNHWADQAAVDAAVAAAESFGQAQAAFLAEAIAMEDTAAENTNCSKKEETKKDKDLEPEVMDSAESTTAV